MPNWTMRRVTLLVMPPALLASMSAVYRVAPTRLGARRGYLIGFLCYWVGWCALFPLWLLGRGGLRDLFRDTRPRLGRPAWVGLACLLVPPSVGAGFALPSAIRHASRRVVVASALIAIVNAVGEETLWRGTFRRLFPDRILLGHLYPAVGFALWHYAPQSVFPNRAPGGGHSLVAVAGAFGLLWGWLVQRTGSLRWTTLSHLLLDFSGLGARLYLD
jgi:membrane protease YdiL (CAAX protease family)